MAKAVRGPFLDQLPFEYYEHEQLKLPETLDAKALQTWYYEAWERRWNVHNEAFYESTANLLVHVALHCKNTRHELLRWAKELIDADLEHFHVRVQADRFH